MPPTYSLVVPIFNEEAVIPVLLKRLDALLEALDAPGRSDRRRRRIERHERDRDRGQGARRQALSADQAVAQFRPSDRDHRRARSRRWPRGHRDGRGSAGPARSRLGDDRQMEGGLRRRLGRARLASRAKAGSSGRRPTSSIASWGGSATFRRRATPAISAWSIAGRSTAFSPCPSATGSCAACSPGSGSARER